MVDCELIQSPEFFAKLQITQLESRLNTPTIGSHKSLPMRTWALRTLKRGRTRIVDFEGSVQVPQKQESGVVLVCQVSFSASID